MESTRSPDVKRRPMPGKGTRTIVVPSIVLTSLVVISVAAVPMARPQPEARTQGQFERSVLDGVYTEDQAFRGEDAFVANCEGCHIYGEPDDAAPPLLDNSFLDNWREDTLGPLFEHMRTRMPSQAPGSLTDLTYLDILSYILWEHGMPFGEQELTEDAARSTQLVGLDGPQPFPNLALLGVVGCLGRSDGPVDSGARQRSPDQKRGRPIQRRRTGHCPGDTFRPGHLLFAEFQRTGQRPTARWSR